MAPVMTPCGECGGTGFSRSSSGRCPGCRGYGRRQVACSLCNGRGSIGRAGFSCSECGGSGRLDPVLDARLIDIQKQRKAEADAGIAAERARRDAKRPAPWPAPPPPAAPPPTPPPSEGPYRRDPAPIVHRDLKPENAIVESTIVYDDDAQRSTREAWDAAEGPQRGVRPGRRAA